MIVFATPRRVPYRRGYDIWRVDSEPIESTYGEMFVWCVLLNPRKTLHPRALRRPFYVARLHQVRDLIEIASTNPTSLKGTP